MSVSYTHLKAAVQIFNSKKDRGKISIDKNKYRYLLKYNPPKNNYSIVFLDRTLEISTINKMCIRDRMKRVQNLLYR